MTVWAGCTRVRQVGVSVCLSVWWWRWWCHRWRGGVSVGLYLNHCVFVFAATGCCCVVGFLLLFSCYLTMNCSAPAARVCVSCPFHLCFCHLLGNTPGCHGQVLQWPPCHLKSGEWGRGELVTLTDQQQRAAGSLTGAAAAVVVSNPAFFNHFNFLSPGDKGRRSQDKRLHCPSWVDGLIPDCAGGAAGDIPEWSLGGAV